MTDGDKAIGRVSGLRVDFLLDTRNRAQAFQEIALALLARGRNVRL